MKFHLRLSSAFSLKKKFVNSFFIMGPAIAESRRAKKGAEEKRMLVMRRGGLKKVLEEKNGNQDKEQIVKRRVMRVRAFIKR
jgi:uncharacterized protein YfaA (DUF2138 family)